MQGDNHQFRMVISIYCIVWLLALITFWIFCREPQMAMFHVIIVQYIILPIVTFILSVFMGRAHFPMRYVWLIPISFAIAYLLLRVATVSLLQHILAGNAAFPNIYDFLAVVIISVIGLLIGVAWGKLRNA